MRVQSEMKTKCTIRMEDSSTSMKSVMKKEGCGTQGSLHNNKLCDHQSTDQHRQHSVSTR